jgi:hypothetical protein
MTARYMLLAKASEELPKREWSRVTKLGVGEAVFELSRRRRDEKEATLSRSWSQEPMAETKAPAAIQEEAHDPHDDSDDRDDRLLTLDECARIEPVVWRLMGTDKWIELKEAPEQADATLHERIAAREISLVEAAIEYAKSKVRTAAPEVERSGDETFTQEEEARLRHVTAVVKTRIVVDDMVQATGILHRAVEVVACDDDHGRADHVSTLDASVEITGRFHSTLCNARHRCHAEGSRP